MRAKALIDNLTEPAQICRPLCPGDTENVGKHGVPNYRALVLARDAASGEFPRRHTGRAERALRNTRRRRSIVSFGLGEELDCRVSLLGDIAAHIPKFRKKAAYDDRVERNLAQRALGYSYRAEKPFQYQGEVVKVQYVEHVPPDVSAAKFWLLNRRPAQWLDTSRHELTGANGGEIEIRERSDLDRARRIAYILSQAATTKS